MKGQSRERQLDIVGPGRLELWEQGNMPFRAMTNPDNSPVSLGKLREMYSFYVDKERFREWFDNPQGDFTIGNLPSHIKELLETKADSLIFSMETLVKQLDHHPDITQDSYVNVLNKVSGCKEFYDRGRSHMGLIIGNYILKYRTI
jgi:hypothetical protein